MGLSAFSREYDYPRYWRPPEGEPYYGGSARAADLPAALDAYARQRGLPSPRGGVTAPSARRSLWQSRNVDRVFHRPSPYGWGLGPD